MQKYIRDFFWQVMLLGYLLKNHFIVFERGTRLMNREETAPDYLRKQLFSKTVLCLNLNLFVKNIKTVFVLQIYFYIFGTHRVKV